MALARSADRAASNLATGYINNSGETTTSINNTNNTVGEGQAGVQGS
jgi:hypothetical protein